MNCTNVKVISKSKHTLPKYETVLAAGMDLRANLDSPITLKPLERALVPTGIFIQLPIGKEAQLRPRSGMAWKHGLTLINCVGTIDADYTGEIKAPIVNLSNEEFTIEDGERICQMVVTDHDRCIFVEVDEFEATERGSGGFGHTGKN